MVLGVVLFFLGVLGLQLTLALDLFDRLPEEHLELCLLVELLVVLKAGALELASFMLHHLTEFFDDSLIAANLVLLSLLLCLRLVDDGSRLLTHERRAIHEGTGVPVGLTRDTRGMAKIALELASSSRSTSFGSAAKGAVLGASSHRLERAVELVEVDHLAVFFAFVLLDERLHVSDLLRHLFVFFLLEDEVLDEELSVVALRPVLTLELSVFLSESSVLVVDALRNVRNQLQLAAVLLLLAHEGGLVALFLEDFVADVSVDLGDLALVLASQLLVLLVV